MAERKPSNYAQYILLQRLRMYHIEDTCNELVIVLRQLNFITKSTRKHSLKSWKKNMIVASKTSVHCTDRCSKLVRDG